MCGIFAICAQGNIAPQLLEGLGKLEYRGYDSAGIGGYLDQQPLLKRAAGRVAVLAAECKELQLDGCGLGHTRWATHGAPTVANAHPHLSASGTAMVVHNGIVENASALRLQVAEYPFCSTTDTEVVVALYDTTEGDSPWERFCRVIEQLHGSYALVMAVEGEEALYAATTRCPMVLGMLNDGFAIASDVHAFAQEVTSVCYVPHDTVLCIEKERVTMLCRGQEQTVIWQERPKDTTCHRRGVFPHFMLKEIHDQPTTLRQVLSGRMYEANATIAFEDFQSVTPLLQQCQHVLLLGCGTSWHACLAGARLIEKYAHIPTSVVIASECASYPPVVPPSTIAIALSQSGETADTLAAVRELKAKEIPVIGLCNAPSSTLEREVLATIPLRAGYEASVASTKAFTSQWSTLMLLALKLGRLRSMTKEDLWPLVDALHQLPEAVEALLATTDMRDIAAHYCNATHFFFIGRGLQYPVALESALKMTEVAYIPSHGLAAGELKHGPLALIEPNSMTIAFTAQSTAQDKMLANIMEIRARDGGVIVFGQEGDEALANHATSAFLHQRYPDPLSPILSAIYGQLFAYQIALARGCAIDYPRNLAKSVTVE